MLKKSGAGLIITFDLPLGEGHSVQPGIMPKGCTFDLSLSSTSTIMRQPESLGKFKALEDNQDS